jgi:hypothetical protein
MESTYPRALRVANVTAARRFVTAESLRALVRGRPAPVPVALVAFVCLREHIPRLSCLRGFRNLTHRVGVWPRQVTQHRLPHPPHQQLRTFAFPDVDMHIGFVRPHAEAVAR